MVVSTHGEEKSSPIQGPDIFIVQSDYGGCVFNDLVPIS